jgi:phosphoadenosine phosphosulfate reductase
MALHTAEEIRALNEKFDREPVDALLGWIWETLGQRAAIGTSFQGAGLVLIHLSRRLGFEFPVFTLDTGLWFPETLALHHRLEEFFGCAIESLKPDLTVEQQAQSQGPELWTRDPDLCCTIRKVMPLQGRLMDLDGWLTGLRREQSDTRQHTQRIELYTLDATSGKEILKFNPMAGWSREAIWAHLKEHHIPYNPLHDQGYRSIGCQPCTRKTAAGGGERAGRWTGFNKTECGIHTFMARKG